MATISQDNNLFTVLVRYEVDPSNQAALVEVLKRSAPTFQEFPGFVSLNMHRGLEGKQVLVYLQWRSQADSDACMSDPRWFEVGKELYGNFIQAGKATMEPQAFEVVQSLGA
jgi:quinol monooxygenase YgiN